MKVVFHGDTFRAPLPVKWESLTMPRPISKRSALFLAAAGLCFGGKAPKTFTGVIHDNRCVGPTCATQCPVTKEPKYTLQSGDEAWLLSDQKTPAQYVGRIVNVTGTVGADHRLKVTSVAPATAAKNTGDKIGGATGNR
jgi:hypothetical protein